MSKWSIQDVLIFRKCGELSNTGDDDDDDNIRAKRRVAKVANILGVNESKNMIGGQSAEMRLLAGRLSSGSTSAVTTGSANLFRVDRIVKDGWLQLEVVKGKYEPHWCYIENENFIAVNKSNTATTLSGTVNLVIRGCDITAVENNLRAFEIKHKYGALMFLSDSEEGRDTWVQVLRKCAAKPAKMSVDETDADYDTEFNKKMKQRKTRVSIDDFELKTVLGRGKFGKV